MAGENLQDLGIKGLFSRLSSIIKSFAKDIENVASRMELEAPSEEVRKIIADIRERAPVAAKEDAENKEIIKLLEQLLVYKKIFSYMGVESKEWVSLVEAIEKRISIGESGLNGEERQDIEKIKELARQMRKVVSEGNDNV